MNLTQFVPTSDFFPSLRGSRLKVEDSFQRSLNWDTPKVLQFQDILKALAGRWIIVREWSITHAYNENNLNLDQSFIKLVYSYDYSLHTCIKCEKDIIKGWEPPKLHFRDIIKLDSAQLLVLHPLLMLHSLIIWHESLQIIDTHGPKNKSSYPTAHSKIELEAPSIPTPAPHRYQ